MKESKSNQNIAWYLEEGKDCDVVLSSRCRAIRNLASFPFPMYFKNDDGERVQALVLDAFSKLTGCGNFMTIEHSSLSPVNKAILEERGILKNLVQRQKDNVLAPSAILMDTSGKIAATVNANDHLRLFSFASGLDFAQCYNSLVVVDDQLQNSLQFASTYDFGYLCSNLKDVGSGYKFSARLHLPSCVRFGKLSAVFDYVKEKGFNIESAFPGQSNAIAAGSFFILSSLDAISGTEYDQVAAAESVCKYIVEAERKIFETFADNKSTVLRNSIIRSFSAAKFSMLLSLKEALDIISDMMLALKLNLIAGISSTELSGLLYRIQNGNLSYLLETGSFEFEQDVKKDRHLKIERLRSLVLQEAFESISLGNL